MIANGSRLISSIAMRGLCGLSCLVLVWVSIAAPIFIRQAPLETVAKHIIAEDSFKPESLLALKLDFLSRGTNERRKSVLNAAAIFDLRILEYAINRGDAPSLDSLIKETSSSISQSLVHSPADPFLWTVLFWLENFRDGFSDTRFKYLDMSYEVGANEGWVAVKRSRLAIALFRSLTPSLTEQVVREFCRLVNSNYVGPAADILVGPGWAIRDVLMAALTEVDESSRRSFAKQIYWRGFDLKVPGVERPEWRPWH